ncbi:MAG: molybdopterin oxidoreductase family protein [Alphaproteobacteria bacterium]|nr:molybdopterin oxidoreductase family protein [Alphaproteobacteria bacterium]
MAVAFKRSACPHDCPSGCALEVEVIDGRRMGVVHGARDNSYTSGVVCAKVGRYAERTHHADRLAQPLQRVGAKGDGNFRPIPWAAALDEIAAGFRRAAERHGPTTVWPYHSGGTMGMVQRYAIERLRNVMGYSRQHSTICMTPAESGWRAGVGKLIGSDPREMAEADLIVMWGGNPVTTQVNAMHHIARARKERGAKLVVVDVYRSPTVAAADLALIVRPGTDGALALAVMNVLLAEGMADRDYLARLTDFSPAIERHIATRTPAWAAAITGLDAQEIVAFARLYGSTRKSFLRVGFGFTRARNGAVNMHAVSCLPAITGSWQERGGGAFFMTWELSGLDTTLLRGLDRVDTSVRALDQSRIGPVLVGDKDALMGGPPVTAMLLQNANSATVAPDSRAVRRGLTRDDLFLVVHEQFMTATAKCADIVLPATMFVEHDDIYCAYGHYHIVMGPKLIEPYAEARPNHEVISGIASRLGAKHPGFDMTAWQLIDAALRSSGLPDAETLRQTGWIDHAPDFRASHCLDGFPQADGRFHFKPDWAAIGPDHACLPALPDHIETSEWATAERPFRLVTAPARGFLNSTFSETPGSRRRESRPTLQMHPDDAAAAGLADGSRVRIGNARGEVVLAVRSATGLRRGTVVAEGIWPASDHETGEGINTLVGADPVPPNGGVAFHDTSVWLRAEL